MLRTDIQKLSMHVTNELFLLRNGFHSEFCMDADQLATLPALFVLLIAKKARSPIL